MIAVVLGVLVASCVALVAICDVLTDRLHAERQARLDAEARADAGPLTPPFNRSVRPQRRQATPTLDEVRAQLMAARRREVSR